MGYFKGANFFGDYLEHSGKKRDLNGESTSSEKGTDNKNNNTSEYNHDYYEENKDKWEDNKKSSKKSKKDKSNTVERHDYDPNGDDEDFKKVYGNDLKNPKLNMDTHIKGTDFYQVTNKEGQVVLINGNKKWVLPKGVKLTAGMIQQLSGIDSKQGKQGDEFNKKMAKFMEDQKFKESAVSKETKKKTKSTKSNDSEKEEAKETKSTSSEDPWKRAKEEYYNVDKKKKQSKSMAHSDWGSVLVKDLF